jgi:two-component system KDP operon response regulator KdpE
LSELIRNAEILVVEDDPALLHILRAALDYGGFGSESASNASDAWHMLSNGEFDAIVMDLGLPDVDGFHLIRQIRDASPVPIIVVSGLTGEADRIRALDCGADDFVSKPFLPGELLARVRAILRRHSRQEPVYEDKNALARPLARPGTAELGALSALEARLFDLLSRRRDEVVSEADIVHHVWGDQVERGSNHVRLLVLSLRRKLDDQRAGFAILNHRGRGYRLTGRR